MNRSTAHRLPSRLLATVLTAAVLTVGVPSAASAVEPPPAPTGLSIVPLDGSAPGVPCGPERLWIDGTAGFQVRATATFPNAQGRTSVTTWLRVDSDDGSHSLSSWSVPIGQEHGWPVPATVLRDGGEYTVRLSAYDGAATPPEGPSAECLVGVRMRAESPPAVLPVYGADVVYDGVNRGGGIGVAGSFVIFPDPAQTEPPYEEVVAYDYALSPSVFPMSWSTVPKGADLTVVEVVPATSGLQGMMVRNRFADGLVGAWVRRQFEVPASPATWPTPSPLIVFAPFDEDRADGLLPLELRARSELEAWERAEVAIHRGDVELARVPMDDYELIPLSESLLGEGAQVVTLTYQMFPGAPVWSGEHQVCFTGCSFFTAVEARFDNPYDVIVGRTARIVSHVEPGPERTSYQWFLDGEPVPGATSSNYAIGALDNGRSLSGAVTYERAGYEPLTLVTESVIVTHQLPRLYTQAEVQGLGQLGFVPEGDTAGTVGQGLPLVRLWFRPSASLRLSGHFENVGWKDGRYMSGGHFVLEDAGRRIEAIRLSFGEEWAADNYDVYYRVHSPNLGWLGWAKNGEPGGTEGYSYPMEAVQVRVALKGDPAPAGSGLAAFYDKGVQSRLSVAAHVQDLGWMAPVAGGQTAGTEGRSLRVEALRFGVEGDVPGGIEASTHVQNAGWQPFVGPGGLAGTEGQGLRVEAFRIRLTGQLAEKYDVYYRTHAQNFGWLGWAKNGEDSGTAGYSYRLEAVQVLLVPKGDPAPSDTGPAFHQGG